MKRANRFMLVTGVPLAALSFVAVRAMALAPQEIEVVRFGQLDGNVSLVLRSPVDHAAGDVSTTGVTLMELADMYGVLHPQPVTP